MAVVDEVAMALAARHLRRAAARHQLVGRPSLLPDDQISDERRELVEVQAGLRRRRVRRVAFDDLRRHRQLDGVPEEGEGALQRGWWRR